MNFSRIRFLFLSLMSLLATAMYAVEQLPEKEEDIPVEFIPTLDTTVSFGLHHLTGGPKVRFGHLGVIQQPSPSALTSDPRQTGVFDTQYYSNGTVTKDARTTYELDGNGNAIANGKTYTTNGWVSVIGSNGKVGTDGTVTVFTPISTAEQNSDGTYVPVTTSTLFTNADGSTTISDTNVLTWASTSKFLAYQDNRTRNWSVQNPSQISTDNNHTVSMSTYGVESAGVSIDADSTGSTGFELTLERRLGKRGHFEWGISGGLQLVEINAKAYAVIQSNLTRTTDIYKMIDTGLNPAYSGTTTDGNGNIISLVNVTQPAGNSTDLPLVDLNGTNVIQYSSSTSAPGVATSGDQTTATPLDTNPNDIKWGTSQTIGTVNIHGFWQVKGAYYLVRLGPSMRYNFNDRWSISGNFGLSMGYVGTVFRADEYFNSGTDTSYPIIDDPNNASIYSSKEQNTTHKFIPGYYGEINAEYWMTERTGFYFGMTRQTMRAFNQDPLSGRTAKIDMGSNSGWRIGIMTRF